MENNDNYFNKSQFKSVEQAYHYSLGKHRRVERSESKDVYEWLYKNIKKM